MTNSQISAATMRVIPSNGDPVAFVVVSGVQRENNTTSDDAQSDPVRVLATITITEIQRPEE